MRDIGSSRPDALEVAWGAFAVANLGAMLLWGGWETIPFHFIWISLTLLYGFRVWRAGATYGVLALVAVSTGTLITADALSGDQGWGELFEVPLMAAMFLAMVWHARRRQEALQVVEREAEARASLLSRQERFIHDASHELRTPVTIARGHLELLRRLGSAAPEADVALDELARIERILDRLLLLAKADQLDFVSTSEVDTQSFLEDVFLRWTEVAPRRWRLGTLATGVLVADSESLRAALDALLENAVKYTGAGDPIELRSHREGNDILIEVSDGGCGVPAEALDRIFDRFARADAARSRADGGVGLGLAIVDAIAKAHGGTCCVRSAGLGATFSLRLPRFRACDHAGAPPPFPAAGEPALSPALP